MRSKKVATWIAVIGGILSFMAIAGLLRFHAWLPLVGGTTVALLLLGALWPRRLPAPPAPKEVTEDPVQEVLDRLMAGADCLSTYARAAPSADAPLFTRMAELLEQIRAHHVANPSHATTTRRFVQHVLGRMLSQIANYMDLVNRAGPEEGQRLADISRQFEGFVPVLERIDKACLANDLDELEISVEVLNQQLDRGA
ncbi:MAG: hypothetical protein AAGK00_00015 [Pseudomonadota bacterium]